MKLPVLYFGNPVLRRVAIPVPIEDIPHMLDLVLNMEQTMLAEDGLGLAAPQVGRSIRLFVYKDGDETNALFNPEVKRKRGKALLDEGCLSIPGLLATVKRNTWIEVSGYDRNGQEVLITAEDMLARVFQHEIDHLNGKMIVDRAEKGSVRWAKKR